MDLASVAAVAAMTAKKPPAATTRRSPALYVTRNTDVRFYSLWAGRPRRCVTPGGHRYWGGEHAMLFCATDFERLTGVSMPGGPTSIRKLTVKLTKVGT